MNSLPRMSCNTKDLRIDDFNREYSLFLQETELCIMC